MTRFILLIVWKPNYVKDRVVTGRSLKKNGFVLPRFSMLAFCDICHAVVYFYGRTKSCHECCMSDDLLNAWLCLCIVQSYGINSDE